MDVGTIINGLMVLVTISIALVAWWTFKSQTRPKIIVYIHHDHLRPGYLKIRIHNIGKDVAKDISFKMETPIPDIKGPLLTGLPSLAPGEYRESGWGVLLKENEFAKNTRGATYKIKCEYRHGRKVLRSEDIIETDSFADKELIRLSPYKDIVTALKPLEVIDNKLGSLHDRLISLECKLIEVSVLGRDSKEYLASRNAEDTEK